MKSNGALEHNAMADLWKNTLSQIPTAYGRLSYLASLRDPNSGIYRHHGLAAMFGRDESSRALRQSQRRQGECCGDAVATSRARPMVASRPGEHLVSAAVI